MFFEYVVFAVLFCVFCWIEMVGVKGKMGCL